MTGMDRRLKEKRRREEKRLKAHKTSNKISRAKMKGEEALERIERIEMIIAHIPTDNLPKHVEAEVESLKEEVEERTNYKELFIDEFIPKLCRELNDKNVDYIRKNGEKLYTIRDGEIYNYYSTKSPTFEEVIENYEEIDVDTHLDGIVERIKNGNDTNYKEIYMIITD